MKRILFVILLTQIAWSSARRRTCPDGRKFYKRGISQEDRNKIVEIHNELRNLVAKGAVDTQGPAQNMMEMTWDEDLMEEAQKWANNCKFRHDPHLKGNGQNIYMGTTTFEGSVNAPDFKQFVQYWFDEVKKSGYENGEFSYHNGHYSQIIWANTKRVGCGYSAYEKEEDSESIIMYFVCNYSPAGNVLGELAYIPGERNCEAHGLTDSTEFSDLCN